MKERLSNGKTVIAQVEIIRPGYLSRTWSRISYNLEGQVYSKEMEVSINEMNKDQTIYLLINENDNSKFIILPS